MVPERNYDGAPTDGSAWIEGGDCKVRFDRDGAWNFPPDSLCSAFRDTSATGYRISDIDPFAKILTERSFAASGTAEANKTNSLTWQSASSAARLAGSTAGTDRLFASSI